MEGGGGGPPFFLKKFPLTFWKNLVRGGPGGGGGTPQRKVSVPGGFEPFPKDKTQKLRAFMLNLDLFRTTCETFPEL